MSTKVHFMSERSDWETPQFLFDGLNAEFGFELDVCAAPHNAKCKQYYTATVDGLAQNWTGVCWMNPPYGREIEKWIRKAFESAENGALVVCLVPARTDTRWWHRYVLRGEIRFLKGRLKFGGSKNSAPFPSAIVIFRPPTRGKAL
jgi:phage N-6-adenine-methyltransferase